MKTKRKPKVQYTIRAVPPEVDKILRDKAKREDRSLNDVALEALRTGAGLANEPKVYHDLDHLAGTWIEDPEFDAAIAEFEKVDPESWR